MKTEENNITKENLKHAFINQLESDFKNGEFESMDTMLESLMINTENKFIIFDYLSEDAKIDLQENLVKKRY